MKQKVIKPIFLLMITASLCFVPLHGYYPFVVGWFSAICSIPHLQMAAWPVIMYFLYKNAGILVVMKYGIFLLSLGFCLGQYRKRVKKYNYYISAFITLIFGIALEGMEWYMDGKITEELFFLIPILVIECAVTVVFSYLIKMLMYYIPFRKKSFAFMKRFQTKQMEDMLRTSAAFKNLSSKISRISNIQNEQFSFTDDAVENEINNQLCVGCENGQVQYMERVKLNYLWYNKMIEVRQAMAIQFSEMADIMEGYTKQPEYEKKSFFGMENYLKKRLKDQKIYAKKILISLSQKDRIEVRLMAKRQKKAEIKTETIEKLLSQALARPMRMSDTNLSEVQTEYHEYLFYEDVNFNTISGTARRIRSDQNVSGDRFTHMELDSGQTFMSICDGMGSGEQAGKYSEMVIDLLEQLLESGFSEETALKLVNSVMLTNNEWQEPATLDMALIDRYSGTCRFLKMGAACTYIKRGNWVECIKSTSLPIGVLENVDTETITKKMYDGDFVIMVSDGIVEALDCRDKEECMGRIIMDIHTLNPKEMALTILSKSLERTGGIPKDDMTVICTGIWDKWS